MQTDLENKSHLPNVSRKPQSIHSLFELIRQKKAEFSKELDHIEEPSLPHINNQRKSSEGSSERSINEVEERQMSESHEAKLAQYHSHKYKTILEQNKLETPKRDRAENSLMLSRKQNLLDKGKGKIDRTKTEFRPIEPRKMTSNTSAAHALQGIKEEQKLEEIEEAKKQFYVSVELIPKNMKLRNEDNLSQSIAHLETFNPFFYRNQRILNICLLKMGRIILRDSPYQLYKAGEELDHFYIILAGKVKIVQGFIKRVCQTGETVLEETLFTEKGKRLSLERAKVIGPTYLLELQIEEYKKLKEELIRYGLKLSFQEMQAIIKRNFIIKNWMRNKRRTEVHK